MFCFLFVERLPTKCKDTRPFLIGNTENDAPLWVKGYDWIYRIWPSWILIFNVCVTLRWRPFRIAVIWLDQPHSTFMNVNFPCSHYTVMAPFLNRGLLSLWSNVIIRIIGYVFYGCMVKSQYCLISLCAYAYNQESVTCFGCIKLSMKFVKPAVQHDALKVFFFPFYGIRMKELSSPLIVNLKWNQKEANE